MVRRCDMCQTIEMRRLVIRKRKTRAPWRKKKGKIYIYMYIRIHVYTCIYIYTHAYMYTYGARESTRLVVHTRWQDRILLGAALGWGPFAGTKRNGNTSPLLQVFRIDSSASTERPFPLSASLGGVLHLVDGVTVQWVSLAGHVIRNTGPVRSSSPRVVSLAFTAREVSPEKELIAYYSIFDRDLFIIIITWIIIKSSPKNKLDAVVAHFLSSNRCFESIERGKEIFRKYTRVSSLWNFLAGMRATLIAWQSGVRLVAAWHRFLGVRIFRPFIAARWDDKTRDKIRETAPRRKYSLLFSSFFFPSNCNAYNPSNCWCTVSLIYIYIYTYT